MVYSKEQPLTLRMQGRLLDNDGNDHLQRLQDVLERNRGACELPIGELAVQVLKLAERNLRISNVWETDWPNGERVLFIGRLPQFVSEDAVLRASVQHI